MTLQRRSWLQAGVGVGLGAWALAGCEPSASKAGANISGGWQGISHERGHLLRDARALPAPGVTRRARVVIAGGGVAGLAAARALRLRGIDDFCLLELEDAAGGNSRSTTLGGMACPLGAHYLPLPTHDAREVQDLLEELGLRQRVAGRWQYDERHLCHSPQERLFFEGNWHEGLLPVQGAGPQALGQYRRFAELVERAQKAARYAIPSTKSPLVQAQRSLDAITFVAWLDQNGLTDPQLRWYLDYCCRDDYGAGIAGVSAWAGIHYFASRHGFHAPGDATAQSEPVLTWPEGNAWLTQRLAAPLGDRLQPGRVVTRIASLRHGVEVDAFNAATQTIERWQARHCIVALPIFVAARVIENAPQALREAAARIRYAPWLVANIELAAPLNDRPGAPPSWDNVVYGTEGLGYVDATHQSLKPVPGATVLTCYRALGLDPARRQALYSQPWTVWRDQILAELAVPHPDLAAKARHMEITRYGHAMAVPVPGFKTHLSGLLTRKSASNGHSLLSIQDRLHFAHSDWAGYSVFEEAFTLGHLAGSGVV